jgi:hypothetical protein
MRKVLSRREMLQQAGCGFGSVALSAMLAQSSLIGGTAEPVSRKFDLTPKAPHFAPKAKNVIFIYVGGGPSTIDMFDPKPVLTKFDGKPAPFEIKGRALNGSQQVMASPWPFQRYGQTGRWVSDLLPHFAQVVDEVTFLRSMTTDRIDHSTAQFTFVTGRGFTGFPAIGAWVSYALGTENQNLPGYIVMETGGPCSIASRAYSSAWLPPIYSGTTMMADAGAPMYDIKRPESMTGDDQSKLLETLSFLNQRTRKRFPLDQDLESRVSNYELAAKMQLEASRVADISQESEATKKMYGIEDRVGGPFARTCLVARRLVENGVRFVQLISSSGGGAGWDTHFNIKGALPGLCKSIDQGMAALLADLKQRGMLKDTLVVWSGEFGRLPTIQANTGSPGRDHNPFGFSMWMAGAGIKPGIDFGDTDELGYAALKEHKTNHSDVHATVQNLLGIDYFKNTFPYEGRNESLVGVNPARVIREILA